MNADGFASSIRDKILTIHVKPGWKEGTKVIFSKEGDQVKITNHQTAPIAGQLGSAVVVITLQKTLNKCRCEIATTKFVRRIWAVTHSW